MTVQELINELANYDGDARVMVDDPVVDAQWWLKSVLPGELSTVKVKEGDDWEIVGTVRLQPLVP